MNKHILDNMQLKKWIKNEILLAKDIHIIIKKTDKLEQNLAKRDKIDSKGNNPDKNFVKKEDELIIQLN